jgi:CheY-like chemotaxis protein
MSGEEGSLGDIRKVLAGITQRLDALAATVGAASRPNPPGALLDEPTRARLAPLESILDLQHHARADAPGLALDRAVWHARADVAAILTRRADGRLEMLAERGLAGLDVPDADAGIVGRALRSGEVVQAGPGLGTADALLTRTALGAAAAIPIRGASPAVLGVLLAGRRRPVPFEAAALGTLLLVADRLAISLGAGAAPDSPELAATPTDELLAATLDLPRAARAVAAHAAARLGASAVAVLVPAGEALELAGGAGIPPGADAPARDARAIVDALATRRPSLIDGGAGGEPALSRCLGAPARAVVPLVADDTVVALLAIGASRPCATSLPAPVARAAALALRNARLHAEALRALGDARPEPPRAPTVSPAPLGEIASLLAVVLGRLAAVRERLVDPDAARELAVGEEAAWRIAESLRRLLGFAPSAAAHVAAPLELGSLVRDAVRTAEHRWSRDEGAPPVTLDVETVPAVRGSGEEIRHALDHLLQNAREAGTGQTPITVRVRWDGAARVALEVADQGRGMDEPTRRRAGEPFFTTKGPGRLGVGLAVAQAAATRHRGDLLIDSAPGRGTTVRLRLPVAGDLADAAVPASPSGNGAPHRILVVEDEKPVRDSVVEVLELQGYSVLAATSGPEAAALLRREPVDAVVADFALPSGSGLEVGRVAKEIRPGTPVVLVTGWPGRIDGETLERHGIDAVVEKPVGLETLCATLAALLGRAARRPG